MMLNIGTRQQNNTIEDVTEVLKNKGTFVIIFPEKAVQDTVAASLALYLALIKFGKDVYIVSSGKFDYNLPAIEKVQNSINIKGDSLKISFPYTEGSVDKIDWKIEGDRFNIVITPMQGYSKLDPSKVKFSYTGGIADSFVVIGAATLNSLGKIYLDNKEVFQGEIVNIDRHFTNTRFGSVNLINTGISSLSEIIYEVIRRLGVELDQDIATCLYVGLTSATNNFTGYNVKPETLETAAALLRAGARKIPLVNSKTRVTSSTYSSASTPRPITFSVQQSQSLKPMEDKKIESSNVSLNSESQVTKKNIPPKDWLKPKIFSGKKIGE